IKEMIRVLKPNHTMAITVPRYLPELICWKLSKEYSSANQGHLRIYKKKEVIKLFETHGLKFLSSHFAHGLHSPYWWLKCFIGPSKQDNLLINLYHRFLVWDIMENPKLTRFLDYLLNPAIGKSLVTYFKKNDI
ncbi:MAG: SAM-dependent methyltransferase, partial [Desulfobacterales bacterium]|nr:SAM-dependent methyltransferase [Desulfobacterales bacterium]